MWSSQPLPRMPWHFETPYPRPLDTNPKTNDGHEEEQEDSSENARPLLFFYDSEATGFSVYNDCITEIAAKVTGVPLSSVSNPSFSNLIHTPQNIPERVAEITGITADLLRHQSPFSTVFPQFLKWIAITTKEVSEQTHVPHRPVLVAHNGFAYDFPLLLAEIERRPGQLTTSSFHDLNISFADSLICVQQAKKDGHHSLSDVKQFGLENLYCHFLPDKTYSAHRALPDVEALEELFTTTPLKDLLSSLPTRTARKQLRFWCINREKHSRTSDLRHSLGIHITDTQAKRLDTLGLSYTALCETRASFPNDAEFQKVLQERGVRSGPLREKLTASVPK